MSRLLKCECISDGASIVGVDPRTREVRVCVCVCVVIADGRGAVVRAGPTARCVRGGTVEDSYCYYYYYYSFRRLPSPPHVLEMTVCRVGNDGARAGSGQAWDPAEQLWGRRRISRPGGGSPWRTRTSREREDLGRLSRNGGCSMARYRERTPSQMSWCSMQVDCGSQCAHTEGVTPP